MLPALPLFAPPYIMDCTHRPVGETLRRGPPSLEPIILRRQFVQYARIGAMKEIEDAPAGLEMLSKANAVITVLESRGELTVGEIAGAVDLPTSSTYRLLGTL